MFIAYVIKANQARRLQRQRKSRSSQVYRNTSAVRRTPSSVRSSRPPTLHAHDSEEEKHSDPAVAGIIPNTQEFEHPPTKLRVPPHVRGVSLSSEETMATSSCSPRASTGNGRMPLYVPLSPMKSDGESAMDREPPVTPQQHNRQHTQMLSLPQQPFSLPQSGLVEAHSHITGDSTSRQRGHTVENVLAHELGYTADLMGQYRTELQEYYEADQSEGDDAV